MFNYNEVVEVVFQGTNLMSASGTHPMHLHGHSFYVVGSGFGNYNGQNGPLASIVEIFGPIALFAK